MVIIVVFITFENIIRITVKKVPNHQDRHQKSYIQYCPNFLFSNGRDCLVTWLNDRFNELLFVLLKFIYFFFYSPLGDESDHLNDIFLTHTMCPSRSLLFNSWIPPKII